MSVVNTCLLSLDSVPLSGQGAPVTYTLNVRVALAVQIPVYFSINEMGCKEKKNVLGLIYQSQPHRVKKKSKCPNGFQWKYLPEGNTWNSGFWYGLSKLWKPPVWLWLMANNCWLRQQFSTRIAVLGESPWWIAEGGEDSNNRRCTSIHIHWWNQKKKALGQSK